MQLFEIAKQSKEVSDSKRRGANTVLKSTIAIPYFKGVYRKGSEKKIYSIKSPLTTVEKGKKKVTQVLLPVKPLTGTFLMSYFSCLAYCIVKEHNANAKPEEKQVLSTYVVEALLTLEGFNLEEYSQGETKGAKRIYNHFRATAERENLPLKVDSEGVITGLTDKIVSDVLSAI